MHYAGTSRRTNCSTSPPGLQVLTQGGRVAKQLIGEDSPIDKEYLVRSYLLVA